MSPTRDTRGPARGPVGASWPALSEDELTRGFGPPAPVATGPRESRARLSQRAIAGVLEHYQAHGRAALDRVYHQSPAQYLKLVFSLLPKHIKLEESHGFADLDATELESFIRAARDRVRLAGGGGGGGGETGGGEGAGGG